MAPDDLAFLRATSDEELARLDDEHPDVPERRLHGEPHDGNRLVTPSGIRWIDFESCCLGPPEWDLAFLPDAAAGLVPDVDGPLLARLRRLNSARVATWCWATAHLPIMRTHGELHLALLRDTAHLRP
jgi:aminoglycoside phosphotransferase (APT) family kinase protein